MPKRERERKRDGRTEGQAKKKKSSVNKGCMEEMKNEVCLIRMERIAEGCMDEGRKREGERNRQCEPGSSLYSCKELEQEEKLKGHKQLQGGKPLETGRGQ